MDLAEGPSRYGYTINDEAFFFIAAIFLGG